MVTSKRPLVLVCLVCTVCRGRFVLRYKRSIPPNLNITSFTYKLHCNVIKIQERSTPTRCFGFGITAFFRDPKTPPVACSKTCSKSSEYRELAKRGDQKQILESDCHKPATVKHIDLIYKTVTFHYIILFRVKVTIR